MPKVLLVEDDARIASFVRRGLEAEGYVVDLAESGREALALARENAYPLIILDRMLPGHRRARASAARCAKPAATA